MNSCLSYFLLRKAYSVSISYISLYRHTGSRSNFSSCSLFLNRVPIIPLNAFLLNMIGRALFVVIFLSKNLVKKWLQVGLDF